MVVVRDQVFEINAPDPEMDQKLIKRRRLFQTLQEIWSNEETLGTLRNQIESERDLERERERGTLLKREAQQEGGGYM